MKRILAVPIVAAVFFVLMGIAAAEEKYETTPEMLRVELEVTERINGAPKMPPPKGEHQEVRTYVRKEYLVTANDEVNKAIARIVDSFDEQMAPMMQEEDKPSSRYTSRLDIETVYTVSGKTVSTLILARETFRRVQLRSPFATGVYDLETGNEIFLADLFAADSPAWEVLADGVTTQLQGMFPNEPRNPEMTARLTSLENLKTAQFTLSGGELTLHYPADEIYPGKPNILHVRFYYPQFDGMWTETGEKATDNSRWKFIALTFDDGPNYLDKKKGGSRWALPQFREAGWRVTYFIWGKNIISKPDVLMTQADNNHSMQNHSMTHPNGVEVKSESSVRRQVSQFDENMSEVIGVQPTVFRAPFGSIKPWLQYGIDMPVIQWSIDPKDPNARARTIVKRLKNALQESQDGGIVLLHDTRTETTKAIPQIAELLRENGYMTVTVDELAAINGIALQPGEVYYRLTSDGASGK